MSINDLFFDSSYQHAWKEMMPNELTNAEVEFIYEVAQLGPSSKILDLMCGHGRHSLGLAKRGCLVTAVDNLESYASELNETAENLRLPLHVSHSNVLEFEASERFDAIINMGNSFSFFDRTESLSLIRKVGLWLKHGGVFILNSWSIAEITFSHFRRNEWHRAGNFISVLENELEFLPTRVKTHQSLICPNGNIEESIGVDFIYSLNEIEEMFHQSGLKITGLFSTPKKKSFKIGDSQIYIVAKRIIDAG